MSVNFTGSGLSLESVAQTGLTAIQVRMTYDPLQVNPAGANDALNPANWTLVGPGISGAAVTSCGTVFGDTQSIFLFTSAPLAGGIWTVTASTAIQTAAASPMSAPRTLQFTASPIAAQAPVNPGAETDTSETILRKHFNPALVGVAWDAILAGIAVGEDYNTEQSELAFDQLFKVSASGFYLDRRAGDDGLQRPAGVGMPDDLFRQYAIKTTNNQLTEGALLDVLQVFYGADALRAHCDTAVAETYALHDRDDLTVLLDETLSVTVTFAAADFGPIGLARASEVAAAITRALRLSGSTAYAVRVVDPTTGLAKVRIYSGSFGLGSSVRVTGGKAQTILQFPTLLSVFSGLPTWTLTYIAPSGTVRFTPNGSVDLSQIRVGDYVAVYGGQFTAANRGSWVVTNVSWSFPGGVLTQYFDVVNLAGGAQAGVVQAAATDLMFFRPTRASIHDVPARAVVVSSLPTEIDLVLPATSQSVGRGVDTAAYPPCQPVRPITTAVRDSTGLCTVTCPLHGLTVGEHVYVDGTAPAYAAPSTTAGDSTHTSYSAASLWSAFAAPASNPAFWTASTKLKDGRVIVAGGKLAGGALRTYDDLFTVTASTPHQPNGTQYTVTLVQDCIGQGQLDATRWFSCLVTLTDPLASGKALIFGGMDAAGSSAATTSLLYTPNAAGSVGSWGSSAAMQTALAGRAGVNRATDNKVMAIGGGTIGGAASNAVETYTFTGNAWVASAAMSIARCQPAALQLSDGTVLVCGGRAQFSTPDYSTTSDLGLLTPTAEVYTVISNTWATVGAMTMARVGHQLFSLPDGRAIAIGGVGYDPTQGTAGAYLASTEIYQPNLKAWLPGPSMRVGRAFYAAWIVGTLVYVAGGSPTDLGTEYLDTTTLTWKAGAARLAAPALKTSGAASGSGPLVLGYGQNGSAPSTEVNLGVMSIGSESWSSGGLNGVQAVTSVVDANTYTFSSPTALYTAATGGTSTGFTAPTSPAIGPHVFDTRGGVAWTGSKSTTSQTLALHGQYASVAVADATQFPDSPGWIVFNFGFSNQVGPVKYLGRLSGTALALDYTYSFPNAVALGSTVNLLALNGSYVPASPETEGAFYLTASPAGRVAATKAAQSIAAAGVSMVVSVTYPGDRGLGGEGLPVHGAQRLSDRVTVWASDQVDADVAAARVS